MAEGDRLGNPSASTGPSILGVGDGSSNAMTNCYDSRQSPPKAIVDSSPLQPAMDKNKESLKVKLMVRRPITQLVEQGIMPPLKTSPAIHEQCKQLERAKTGDLLKAKIQSRPDRQELERRHILEHDESHVDPSLAEKQRMLKKARLADQLNSQISHRPGPLELIKKNILHTEKPIERIVKEGLVSFKATSEGLLNRPQQPNSYITFEDDSQSSEGDTRNSPARTDVLEAAATSAGIVTVALTIPTSGGAVVVTSAPVLQTKFHPTLISTPYVPPPPPPPPANVNKSIEHIQVKQDTSNLFAELCQSVAGPSPSPSFLPLVPSPASLGSSTSTLSPLSSVSSPPQSLTPRLVQSPLQHVQQSQKSDAPGKDKIRKKSKSKPVSKARTIKFHEYKGPPNAQKNFSADSNQTEETSYQLMLEQQNCLLRFLEKLNKNQTILPAPTKSLNSLSDSSVQSTPTHPPPLPSPALSMSSSIPPSPAPSYAESTSSEITKLEKMKVSDLKLQLKKRNLPVSGPKPLLIERLKPYLPLDSIEIMSTSESISGETCDLDTANSPHHSLSPESEHENMDVQQADSPCPTIMSLTNDDLVREQQRKIDELQRQLQRSQQELQQIRQSQQMIISEPPPPPINQKLVVKQQLEAKIQKQQAKHQAQLLLKSKQASLITPKEEKPQATNTPIPIAKQPPPPPPPNNVGIVWNGEHQTLLLVGLQDKKVINGHQRAASMPSIVFPIATTQTVEQMIDTKPILHQSITNHEHIPQIQVDIKPPPLYEEATKQLLSNVVIKEEHPKKTHIKSENLTDVLDILIKNGELPESAMEPTTPSTPGSVIMTPTMLFNNERINIKTEPNTQPLVIGQSHQHQSQQSQQQQQQQRHQQHQQQHRDVFDNSILLSTPQAVQNIEMASPMQPDCHIDNENAAKTLDIFLDQPDVHPSRNGEINHFDDLELMELMSQQLDMDISDETCQNFPIIESAAHQQHKSSLNSRRDMNPSLQPSLNELIQQQQQQQQHHHQQQHQNNNNNHHHHHHHHHSTCNGMANGYSPNSFSLNSGNNNYNSTPMDVCDDFDNPLGTFDFSNLSHDSNINTPPHPFSTTLSSSGATSSNTGGGTGGGGGQLQFGPSPINSCSTSGGNTVGVCGNGSGSGAGGISGQILNGSDGDTFDSHITINQDNILDLFNIDDYKMPWGEVDFAV